MFKKLITVILTGMTVGTIVLGLVQIFLYSVDVLSNLFRANQLTLTEILMSKIFLSLNSNLFVLIPSAVGLLVGFIRLLNKDKRWHGPPDVILSNFMKKK